MTNSKKRFTLGNPIIFFVTIGLVIFGSLMIASAEMGNAAGDAQYLTQVIGKQIVFSLFGILFFILFTNFNVLRWRIQVLYVIYFLILATLIITRFFGSINGAYAWIDLGFMTIQPSEFTKVFMICFGAKLFSKEDRSIANLKRYAICALVYVIIIWRWEKDFGSAAVLFVVCYCVALVPSSKLYNKWHFYMFVGIFVAIISMLFLMSPFMTNVLKNFSDDYMIGRFLASADPFAYQYDYGYHLVMSLASFVTGGIFGLGYGNSIHKYMNFPNPSSDFILPVIVEELGIVGFSLLIIAYFSILIIIAAYTIKIKNESSKIILVGTFIYFIVHFILNVGGVSGLIPLTGVPLLLISYGGSSMLASLIALGLSQSEIARYSYENNSRKIQKNAN